MFCSGNRLTSPDSRPSSVLIILRASANTLVRAPDLMNREARKSLIRCRAQYSVRGGQCFGTGRYPLISAAGGPDRGVHGEPARVEADVERIGPQPGGAGIHPQVEGEALVDQGVLRRWCQPNVTLRGPQRRCGLTEIALLRQTTGSTLLGPMCGLSASVGGPSAASLNVFSG